VVAESADADARSRAQRHGRAGGGRARKGGGTEFTDLRSISLPTDWNLVGATGDLMLAILEPLCRGVPPPAWHGLGEPQRRRDRRPREGMVLYGVPWRAGEGDSTTTSSRMKPRGWGIQATTLGQRLLR
jgi:hypothetical protein